MDHWQHISITNHRCCCCCWSIWVRLLPKTLFMKCHWQNEWTEKSTLLMPYTYCPKPYIKLAISLYVTAFVSLPHSPCLFRICKNDFFFFGRLWPCALLWTCVQGHRQRAALSQRMNIQSNEQKSSEQTKKKNNNNTVETNSQIRKNDAQQIAKTQQQHNCVIDLVVEVLAICTKIYSVCHSNWPKTRWPVTWETAPNIKWNRENKEMCEHQLCKHWWAHDRFDEEAKKSGLLNENSKKKHGKSGWFNLCTSRFHCVCCVCCDGGS